VSYVLNLVKQCLRQLRHIIENSFHFELTAAACVGVSVRGVAVWWWRHRLRAFGRRSVGCCQVTSHRRRCQCQVSPS